MAGEALAGGLQPSSWAGQWAGLLGWGGRAWACPLPPPPTGPASRCQLVVRTTGKTGLAEGKVGALLSVLGCWALGRPLRSAAEQDPSPRWRQGGPREGHSVPGPAWGHDSGRSCAGSRGFRCSPRQRGAFNPPARPLAHVTPSWAAPGARAAGCWRAHGVPGGQPPACGSGPAGSEPQLPPGVAGTGGLTSGTPQLSCPLPVAAAPQHCPPEVYYPGFCSPGGLVRSASRPGPA